MPNPILLHHAGILTMDAGRRLFTDGAMLIENDRITRVGRTPDLLPLAPPDAEIIDLAGKWVLPGFVNTHVHTSQQLGRGLGDDVPLLVWLRERIWPYESNLSEDDSYLSALLCGLEQIRNGTTCFVEAGGQHVPGMARAVSELGLRAALTKSTMDTGEGLPPRWQRTTRQELDAQAELFERLHGTAGGRIHVWFGLRTIFNNSDELIKGTVMLAEKYQTGFTMHVEEVREEVEFAIQTRGASTVRHLEKLGALQPNLLAVHCVWLDEAEIALFAKHGVKVSYNPASAMRVLGMAKIPEMIAAGVCVSLGTDGAPSNNRMSMVDEMWAAALLQKVRLLDPTALPAQTVLEMATIKGAQAALWEDEIGSLEEGKKADLTILDPRTPNMLPLHDPVANMVSAMQTHNIEAVMCDGKWLMRDHKVLSVNKEDILHEAASRAEKIAERAGIRLPERFKRVD